MLWFFAGHYVTHVSGRHCSYTMIKHGREPGNPTNSNRVKLLYDSTNRMESDGLNSLRWHLHFHAFRYTRTSYLESVIPFFSVAFDLYCALDMLQPFDYIRWHGAVAHLATLAKFNCTGHRYISYGQCQVRVIVGTSCVFSRLRRSLAMRIDCEATS